MPAKERIVTLTILLIKEDLTESDCIDESIDSEIREMDVSLGERHVGTLYVKQSPTQPPKWAAFFSGALAPSEKPLRSTSVAAVYLTRASGRLFAITFGHGRHLLRTGIVEGRFGMRATLNSVDPLFIRSVDASTLEAHPFYARRQAARESPLGEFGLDLDRDILRAITGRPVDPALGTQMTGADQLSVRVSASLAKLPKQLSAYLKKSAEGHYKTRFPWVDHIAEVRDPREHQKLNSLLVDCLAQESPNIWGSIPELVDWSNFDLFRYGSPSAGIEYDDITLEKMRESLEGTPLSLELLRQKRVYCISSTDSVPIGKWNYLQCLTAEIDHDGALFLLNGGMWYRINSDFAEQVKDYCRQISEPTIVLPNWGDENEGAYNRRVVGVSSENFQLLDCKLVRHPGMPTPIEFCDLISDQKHLVHIKRYSQSSVLSHLFAQGFVAANGLLVDEKLREKVNELLPDSHKLPTRSGRIDASEYEIVFGIGQSRTGPLNLPFFSQVTLRSIHRTLTQSFGFRVGVTKIHISKLTDVGSRQVRRHGTPRRPIAGEGRRPALRS